MRLTDKVLIGLSLLVLICLGGFAFRQMSELQLAIMAIVPIAFITSLYEFFALFKNKTHRKRLLAWICVLLPLATIWFSPQIGRTSRDIFLKQHLPQLETLIEEQKSDTEIEYLRAPFRIRLTEDNEKTALLWWGSGFPVKHTVLGYVEGTPEEAEVHFKEISYYVHHFAGKWWWLRM